MTFEGYPFRYSAASDRWIWTYDTNRPVDQVFWEDKDLYAWEQRLNKIASTMPLEQHLDIVVEETA